MIYRFGEYELDTDLYELRRDGEPCRLEPQVFDVLTYLVVNHDRVVSKDDLLENVWGDKYVSEAALSSRLMAARRAVGDSGQEQNLIRTVHGRGYRFIGRVEELPGRHEPPAPARPSLYQPRAGALPQTIHFCTTEDGVRLAYARVGHGPPIVKAPNWLTHLEYEWQSPAWRHWWEELAKDHELIRFDQRGSGLSDWNVDDISFEAWVKDLEAVVDAAGVERFALLGISQGGSVAVEYTVRHPERVSHLVLYGAYTRGWFKRGQTVSQNQAVLTLIREGWGQDSPVYRQLFTLGFMPEATPEQVAWFNELQRVSTSAENAFRIRSASGQIDVLDRLQHVQVPTLVLHARDDHQVPFNEGRQLASLIPNARLVTLESHNHLTLEDEPAWQVLIHEVREFLKTRQPTPSP